MKNYIRLAFSVMFISLVIYNDEVNGQSLKKVFKLIENGEIAQASLEVNQFTEKVKESGVDFTLYGLASCLIVCNEKSQNYDPYKALEMVEITSNIDANKTEVNEFLAKYALSIDKVQEAICLSILNQAKKTNTEASYQQAIYVSDKCGFKPEVAELLVNAAFSEAKGKNTLENYYRFASIYPDSKYINEVHRIIKELEFYKAKSILSVKSMNDYIEKYSGKENKFSPVAIHIRDSIVYSKLNKSYSEYVDFMQKYPNSEYNSQIKKELPNLLFKQAISEKDIKLWELFINTFPENENIVRANYELENLFTEKLSNCTSLVLFESFKKRFPNNENMERLSETYLKIAANNTLNKWGLEGNVKSIKTIVDFINGNSFSNAYGRELKEGIQDNILFDENGNILTSNNYSFYKYNCDGNLTEENSPSNNTKYLYNDLGLKTEVHVTSGSKFERTIFYEYNEDNKLAKELWTQSTYSPSTKFYEYDSKGLLMRIKVIDEARHPNYRVKITTFKYLNNNDIEKSTRYESSNEMCYFEKINQFGNIVEEIEYSDDEVTKTLYDQQGNMIEYEKLRKDGSILKKDIYKYDERGNLIEFGSDINKRTYVCEEDNQGNWIKQTTLLNNVIMSITSRKIEYY